MADGTRVLDWRRCAQLGITGVPAYLMEGPALVGAHPYSDLEKLVSRA